MGTRNSVRLFADFQYGEFDGKLWDNEAKKVVYAKWNPTEPRSPLNFNPFETWDGNSPDCSGIYPGENRYKDPMRGEVSFTIMMAERAEMEERAAVRNTTSFEYCFHAKCTPIRELLIPISIFIIFHSQNPKPGNVPGCPGCRT
jgi:hypothetical protein